VEGIGPMSMLTPRSNMTKFFSIPISDAMEPVIWLSYKMTWVRWIRSEREVGIGPMIRLEETLNITN
jgi:hypothetical protein